MNAQPERGYQQDAELADPLTLDQLGVRDLLLRLRELEAEAEHTAALKAAIVDRYDLALKVNADRTAHIRSSIQTWLERCNNGQRISFPDAGLAHLRKTPAKAKVTDAAAFKAWAEEQGFVKPTVDDAKAKEVALQTVTTLGELVPGIELVPAGVGLTVKGP